MKNKDMPVCKINDARIIKYKKRTRHGSEQVFYTGSDERDFDRYRREGGNSGHGVKMHDKPDTIRIQPPERHYYALIIDGEWWWVNGCDECNGRPRDWTTYIECEKHNVCRTCNKRSSDAKTRWGGRAGWQCGTCKNIEDAARRKDALEKVASKEYDELDYWNTDNIVCPHCASSYEYYCELPEGDEICYVCGGEYTITPEYTVTFTTVCKGERVVL